MRVLQVYDLAPNDQEPTEGVGLAIWQLSKALAEMGHEVWLLGGSGPITRQLTRVGKVAIRRVDRLGLMRRTWSPTGLKFTRQLFFPPIVLSRRELVTELSGFDVVHGHIYSGGLAGLLLGRRLGLPVFNTIHGSYYEVWNQIVGSRLAPFVRFAEKKSVLYLARAVDCQIHADRSFADMVRGWGVNPEKLCVIHNGVADELIRLYDEPNGSTIPTYVTARRLVRKNGLDFLLKAFALLLKRQNARLRIAGEGPEYQHLLNLAALLGIRDSVEFSGVIPHSNIPEFIRGGEVAVLPSIAEASSLFLLECMALGRPVVCSFVGGIKEVVDEETAWLVQPGDPVRLAEAMLHAVQHWDESLAKVRKAHARTLERHAWGKVAEKTLKCYNSCGAED